MQINWETYLSDLIFGVLKERRRLKKILGEIMTEDFINLVKTINTKIKTSQQSSHIRNVKKNTCHIITEPTERSAN